MEKCIVKDSIELGDKSKIQFSGYGYYSENKTDRYYLEIDLNQESAKNLLIAFMINPSDTLPEINGNKSKIDRTIKNLIKIAYKKYDKLVILNLYSKISSKPNGLKRDNTNDVIIKRFFKEEIKKFSKSDILIACGHDKKKNYFNEISEIIKHHKDKFNRILYLSLDTEKFKNFIDNKILHPANSVINAYGGCENIMLKELEL